MILPRSPGCWTPARCELNKAALVLQAAVSPHCAPGGWTIKGHREDEEIEILVFGLAVMIYSSV